MLVATVVALEAAEMVVEAARAVARVVVIRINAKQSGGSRLYNLLPP